jgi:hypothetical protein
MFGIEHNDDATLVDIWIDADAISFDEIDQAIEELKEVKEYIEELRASKNDFGAWD